MDGKNGLNGVRLKSVSLIRKSLNRFEADELASIFSVTSRSALSKPAIIKRIIDEHLPDGISLHQLAELDLTYEWKVLEGTVKKDHNVDSSAPAPQLNPSKHNWEAFELVLRDTSDPNAPNYKPTEVEQARSNPRQLLYYLHLEMDAYFQNFCVVKTHPATGAVWIRVQLAESDIQKTGTLVSKSALVPALDNKTKTATMPEWWPTPQNTIYLLYFLNSNYFLAGPIRKEFKKYLLSALSTALGAQSYRECSLQGKDIMGLKELLLQKDSQGQYRKLRTKRSAIDANPLDRTSQLMRKKPKLEENDMNFLKQKPVVEPKNQVVREDENILSQIHKQVERIFGVDSVVPKLAISKPLPDFGRSAPGPEDRLPILGKLTIQFLNEPYRGFQPTPADVGAVAFSAEYDRNNFLAGIKLNCKVVISGPSIIEGFKQMVASNSLVMGASGMRNAPTASNLPSLAPFLENLQSLARNNFVFDHDATEEVGDVEMADDENGDLYDESEPMQIVELDTSVQQ